MKLSEDPEKFINKFDFSIFDEKAKQAMDLAREIEMDSFNMMEKGFTMTQQIYDADLSTNDHLSGLTRFFISLSSTAVFAAIGLNIINIRAYLLLFLAVPVLIVSIVVLVKLVKQRNKIIKKRTEDYQKINETMATLVSASKLRVNAMSAVAEDDPDKMKAMFMELGYTLESNSVEMKTKAKK